MIKSELITLLAEKQTHIPESHITSCVNELLKQMSDTLSAGIRIEIRGFGSFSLRYYPPRRAHNPKTGEKVITAPAYRPHFKPGKEMRERVNETALRSFAPSTGEAAKRSLASERKK